MNNLEFELDTAPWRRYLEGLAEGARIPAAQLLSLMEDEDEQSVEDALELCRERCIFPRVEKLPKTYGFGETARILRSEEQLVKKGSSRTEEEEAYLKMLLEGGSFVAYQNLDTIRKWLKL